MKNNFLIKLFCIKKIEDNKGAAIFIWGMGGSFFISWILSMIAHEWEEAAWHFLIFAIAGHLTCKYYKRHLKDLELKEQEELEKKQREIEEKQREIEAECNEYLQYFQSEAASKEL